MFIADSSNKSLSEQLAQKLRLSVHYPEIDTFADGEKRVRVSPEVVGKNCFVLKSLFAPLHEKLFELALTVDALKRTGASEVTAIVPYIAYQRGDHVFRPGEGVGLEVVIKFIESSGADKIAFVDPHSIKLPEMFHIPTVNVSAIPLFAHTIREMGLDLKDMTLVSPDMGGIRRIKLLSEHLDNANYATINKDRDLASGSLSIGGSEGKFHGTVFIVDDMIATGGTIAQAAQYVSQQPDVSKVYVMATHAVFVGEAVEKLKNCPAKKVFVTDSIPVADEKKFANLEIISLSHLIASELRK